jgi:hypothetical protein
MERDEIIKLRAAVCNQSDVTSIVFKAPKEIDEEQLIEELKNRSPYVVYVYLR